MNWADREYAIGRGVAAIRHRLDEAIQPFVRAVIEKELPELLAQATGSTFPNVSATQLADIPYPGFSLPEQRAIAHILGTLDDKIELNRKMNQTLEEMARALFKSWFVDFDPVRAKLDVRWRPGESLPGLPADLYKLFPDRLAPSQLGEIPEGWDVGVLRDVAESPKRGVLPAEIPQDTPYIGLQNMPRHSVTLSEWQEAGQVTSGKSVFKKGELLFGKLRPYFHKVGIAPTDGVCSTDIVVVRPIEALWSASVLCCISSDEFVSYTDQTSTGTKMPRTSWQSMGRYPICLPSEATLTAFQKIVRPQLDRIVENCHRSRTLAEVRDALLPKLVSGNIQTR